MPSADAEYDTRLEWMKKIVVNCLYSDSEEGAVGHHKLAFNNCLERDARKNFNVINHFFNEPALVSGLIFYLKETTLNLCTSHTVPNDLSENNAVYFVAVTKEPIPVPNESDLPAAVLSSVIEWGFIQGQTLAALEQVLAAFAPSFKQAAETNPGMKEISFTVSKFSDHVSQALKQMSNDVKVRMPSQIAPKNENVPPSTLKEYVDISSEWIDVINQTMADVQNLGYADNGPLAEIDYWRNKCAYLSPLYEQLQNAKVRDVLASLFDAKSVTSTVLDNLIKELNNSFNEAQDNLKFLMTLERYFKNLVEGPIESIAEHMNSMVSGLRMVWIISRYYNVDSRMSPLMVRIAWQLCQKVFQHVNIKTIFKIPAAEAKAILIQSKLMLLKWNEVYFQVREKIELGGRDQRWEFDRKKLFEQTNYLAARCGDLHDIVDVIEQFFCVFNAKLKDITGDAASIDDIVKRVYTLVAPFEQAPFDVFDKKFQSAWDSTLQRFKSQTVQVEEISKTFVNNAFKKLRSASSALDFLQEIQNAKPREAIYSTMMSKLADVLVQYGKEVDVVTEMFEKNKVDPPIFRFQPPVAGSINWCRLLFCRIKESLSRFKSYPDLLNSPEGKLVGKKYVALAKEMKVYEDEKFDIWQKYACNIVGDLLKEPVLCVDENTDQIEVNFKPALALIVKEAKYLDKAGFRLPEAILNITLQDRKLHESSDEIHILMGSYKGLVDSFEAEEKELFSHQIQHLRKALAPGLNRINWASLGISDFLSKSHREISRVQSIVNQVRKCSNEIRDTCKNISRAKLVDYEHSGSKNLPDATTFFEQLNKKRASVVDDMVTKYKALSQPLIKIETLVANTNTGKSHRMKSFYEFWERKIFEALISMVVKNLKSFDSLLLGSAPLTQGGKRHIEPLFFLGANLSAPEVVSSPPLPDVYKMALKFARSVVASTRFFYRWKYGTAIIVPPQIVAGEKEPVIFSFYDDISLFPEVTSTFDGVDSHITHGFNSVQQYLNTWRHYRPLWKYDKTVTLEKFVQKNPTWPQYEEKLAFYRKLSVEVFSQSSPRNVEFVSVDLKPLQNAIESEATSWIQAIGGLLRKYSQGLFSEVFGKINTFDAILESSAKEFDDLVNILSAMTEIRSSSGVMDQYFYDVAECYRTLINYNINVDGEEFKKVLGFPQSWTRLQEKADITDSNLEETKEKFALETQKQVEEFRASIGKYRDHVFETGPGVKKMELSEAIGAFNTEKVKYESMKSKRAKILVAEKLFQLPVSAYAEIPDLDRHFKGLTEIFHINADVTNKIAEWADTLWDNISLQEMTTWTENTLKKLEALPIEWKRLLPKDYVFERLVAIKDSIPLYSDIRSEYFKERHWVKIFALTGQTMKSSFSSLTLKDIFALNLHIFAQSVSDIVSAAAKEQSIENGLREIEEVWKVTRFTVSKYARRNEFRGFVIGAVDEVQTTLDDNMLNMQSISSSKFAVAFETQVKFWEKALSLIGETLEVWMAVQRKWMYLESIFIGSPDIRLQLPDDANEFDKIDQKFRDIMNETAAQPLVAHACQVPGRLDSLKGLAHGLEKCQKSLSEYLETKRNAFPRFFFISDEELLSILGSSDPKGVQEHVIKMHDNVIKLNFGAGRFGNTVYGMSSVEGEVLEFANEVSAEGKVENWMTSVNNEMKRSNRMVHKEAIWKYTEMSRLEWLLRYSGMSTLAGSQVWWTFQVENAFRKFKGGNKYAMKDFLAQCTSQLEELVIQVRSDLTANTRRKINTQIIIDVHARDIIDRFVRDSVNDASDFEWESQLRFYWDHDSDQLVVKQCSGAFMYGNEYMGLNGRLVITPLTDRCYLTITQALSLHLGAAPAGPAGTGKTETVKDLSKALGMLCLVTNCGESLDNSAFAKILSGLVQTGSWGCFDEFNRIELSVLSVISAQIKIVQNALAQKVGRFQFEGREIPIDRKIAIFITMNPGYAGRTELPENLKALFRPVVMVVPDLELICEIMLFSEGFKDAKTLAKKMVVLYKLSREQLSKQKHYDFGLRALKSVLTSAGFVKRQNPDLDENAVLMRSLRDMNKPKFVFEDVPLFMGLINDLFPGLECPPTQNDELRRCTEEVIKEKGLILIPDQIEKVLQLYDTMSTRHTTMIVGPSGGGKSVIIDLLAKAQTKMGLATKLFILNPKAQTVNELYGVLDTVTRDWTDGLLSHIFREINRPTEKRERRYIVLDGDVDAVWVENMNSVMDDNKILTLPNAERIRLQKHAAMLFEVGDLQYASPATVSRCGMVFVDPKNLGHRPYYQRWMKDLNESNAADIFSKLESKYLNPAVDYVFFGSNSTGKPLKLSITYTALASVRQFCTLLQLQTTQCPRIESPISFESLYLFSLIWSVGGCIVESNRQKFSDFMLDIFNSSLEKHKLPESFGSLYDCYFNFGLQEWSLWSHHASEFKYDQSTPFHQILIPTADTVRHTWLLEKFVGASVPVLIVGDTGTSKSVTIQRYLSSLDTQSFSRLSMNFSSRTSAADLQAAIESCVEKKTKDTFGPPAGKKLVIFIDDMSMPQKDKYGTQQPIALLKLLVDRGGFYDRGKDMSWKNLKDVIYVGGMASFEGGRNTVDLRACTKFCAVNVTFPSKSSLSLIFNSILSGHLSTFTDDVRSLCSQLCEATFTLYESVLKKLPPSPSKFHYVFNLRDISRVFEGLCMSTPSVFLRRSDLVRLWRHEGLRIFHDRLISESDRSVVLDSIESIIKEHFEDSSAIALNDPIMFAKVSQEAQYLDVGDFQNGKKILEEARATKPPLDSTSKLVLFDNAIEQVLKVLRILQIPKGHALLVGVGGSGKSSLAKLAAQLLDYKVFDITLSRGYYEASFREDLKIVLKIAGVDDKKTAFIFTEDHVVQEAFLDYLNSLLTAGVIPTLFADDEKDAITSDIRDVAVKSGVEETKDSLWEFFVKRCAANLHIILCMSPTGDSLRIRCRNFPAILNSTVINWFLPWPEEALDAVASAFLTDKIQPVHRDSIINQMVHIHKTVNISNFRFSRELRRTNFVTPKNFLDFINSFGRLLQEKQDLNELARKRLRTGLEKLQEAGQQIDELRAQLVVQNVAVKEKTEVCNKLLEEISASQTEAEIKKTEAQSKEVELNAQNKQIAIDKQEAELALNLALPALEEAKKALASLSSAEITEIRSFAKPPKDVQRVCECICWLKGLKDTSWKSAKGMMSASDFKNSLMTLDVDGIKDSQMKSIKAIVAEDNMTIERMKEISTAGAGLLKFVLAVMGYCDVAREIQPKRAAVASLERNLQISLSEYDRITKRVKSIESELSGLQERLKKTKDEQTQLKNMADLMARRLNAAGKLMSGLSSEKERWSNDLAQLDALREQLTGDCLLSAAFMCYCGPFTWDYRTDLLYKQWMTDVRDRKIPMDPGFKIEKFLASDVEISRWAADGLSTDELSIQNAILTIKGSRYALCIDPQLQALNWIKKKERENGLKISNFNDPDFLKHLELAITYGYPFLFEDVEEYIDPVIDNILNNNIITKGARKVIMLGDKEVDFDPSFRLYMTTKISNPSYSAKVFGTSIVVNYGVTEDGLTAQLLNVVVGFERKQLQEEREALIQEMSVSQKLLKDLEDSLLKELANSRGSMLDNEGLIMKLDETKMKAVETAKKLEIAKTTAAAVELSREAYRSVAKTGAILYFVMQSFSGLNRMYEYSLESFIDVFKQSIVKSKPDAILSRRLSKIADTLKMFVYNFVSVGLFERHKIMFSLQVTLQLLRGDSRINQKEIDLLLKGNVAIDNPSILPPFTWITMQSWKNLLLLKDSIAELVGIVDHLSQNEDAWKTWFMTKNIEDLELPIVVEISDFQKLCVIRCFRVDRLYAAITNFIVKQMGTKFVSPPVMSHQELYERSSKTTPIVFILSPGADPVNDIQKLSVDMGMDPSLLTFISLGQGQGTRALDALNRSIKQGGWLILQNCHLLTVWLRTLEKALEKAENANPAFRLWITTEPSDTFPIGILQRSLKVVTEPPNGLKLNIQSNLIKLTDVDLEKSRHSLFKPLTYVLAFFHAVIQERRKYGKLGWNISYDFNENDFRVAHSIILTYLEKTFDSDDKKKIPWTTLMQLVGEIIYGGRVIDSYDRRVLMTYLQEYMGDFLTDSFQPFFFYRTENFTYQIPYNPTRKSYLDEVEKLPIKNAPDVYGLHPQAEVDYLTNTATDILRSILQLQPLKIDTAGNQSKEASVGYIVDNVKSQLPLLFDVELIIKKYNSPSPTDVVLLQELDRYNELLTCCLSSLGDLQKALKGEIGMNKTLDDLLLAINNGQLPALWANLAPQTQKPLSSWISHLRKRYQQYQSWIDNGEPLVMWLSGLHIPEQYLSALVQTACRKNGWPLDRATLFTEVTKFQSPDEIKDHLATGCYVDGLHIEGAWWNLDKSQLSKADSNGKLLQALPIVKITPIESSKVHSNVYKAPVYITQLRRNAMGVGLVFEAELSTREHESHWILQGVSVVLNDSE